MAATGIIGAVERRNPLPPGIYWVDVIGTVSAFGVPDNSELDKFRDWSRRNASKLHIIRTVSTAAEFDFGFVEPAHDWYLFQVKAPVTWEGPGLPTVATESTEKDDTVQRPPPADPGFELPDVTGKITTGALTGFGTVFGLAVGTWLLTKLVSKGK